MPSRSPIFVCVSFCRDVNSFRIYRWSRALDPKCYQLLIVKQKHFFVEKLFRKLSGKRILNSQQTRGKFIVNSQISCPNSLRTYKEFMSSQDICYAYCSSRSGSIEVHTSVYVNNLLPAFQCFQLLLRRVCVQDCFVLDC